MLQRIWLAALLVLPALVLAGCNIPDEVRRNLPGWIPC